MELKQYNQWLLWRFVNGAKVPINRWGENSGCNKPDHFMSYEEAVAVDDSYTLNGVMGPAFVFTENDPFVGIDLDDARCPSSGKIKEWAIQLITMVGSYTEVSPSLSGVKIYVKASLPNNIKHNAPYADGAVEVYDRGRFFTFTGLWVEGTPRNVNPCDILPFIRATGLELPTLQPVTPLLPTTGGGLALYERAMAYCENVYAATGHRNKTAFSLAGHLRSMVDANGKGLSDGEVEAILLLWNATQAEPLPEREIIDIARKKKGGTPRQTKHANTLQEFAGVDTSNITNATNATETKPYTITPTENGLADFPDVQIPGLVGDITQYIIETALYPQPELAFSAALTLMSVLTGQKVKDAGGTRTNIYVAALAPSGSGKDYGRTVIQDVLIKCGKPEVCGPQDIGSSAGLLRALQDISPVMLFPLDEMGILLEGVNSGGRNIHLAKIGKVFLELYSSVGKVYNGTAYADVRNNPIIHNPHCTIYATSTPCTFWESLTKANLTSGLLARFMFFEGGYVMPNDDAKMDDVPLAIVERCKAWAEYRPTLPGNLDTLHAKTVGVSAAADVRLKQHRRTIAERRIKEEPARAALWSRVAEKSQKLALLFACGRHEPGSEIIIEASDMDAAIAVSNWSCRYLIAKMDKIGQTAYAKDVDEIVAFIAKRGTVTLKDLYRKFRYIPAKRRKEMVNDAIEAGRLEQVMQQTKGRPVTLLKCVVP